MPLRLSLAIKTRMIVPNICPYLTSFDDYLGLLFRPRFPDGHVKAVSGGLNTLYMMYMDQKWW